jgi:hypothetical protein
MSTLLWLSQTEPGHCVLSPARIKNAGKLHDGQAVPDDFGQPIEFRMSDLLPDDIMLSDNYDISGLIVVSEKLRAALEPRLDGHHIQFLPASIINHKGRLASDKYFVLHSQDVCDCIDVKKSRVQWNPLNKSKIMHCDGGLVIKEDAVPDNLSLFRLKHWGTKILVADALAKSLLGGGFVGLRFVDPAQYTGIG